MSGSNPTGVTTVAMRGAKMEDRQGNCRDELVARENRLFLRSLAAVLISGMVLSGSCYWGRAMERG